VVGTVIESNHSIYFLINCSEKCGHLVLSLDKMSISNSFLEISEKEREDNTGKAVRVAEEIYSYNYFYFVSLCVCFYSDSTGGNGD